MTTCLHLVAASTDLIDDDAAVIPAIPVLDDLLASLQSEPTDELYTASLTERGQVLAPNHALLLRRHLAGLRDWRMADADVARRCILEHAPPGISQKELAAFVRRETCDWLTDLPLTRLRDEIQSRFRKGPNVATTWRFLEATFVILLTS